MLSHLVPEGERVNLGGPFFFLYVTCNFVEVSFFSESTVAMRVDVSMFPCYFPLGLDMSSVAFQEREGDVMKVV